MRDSVRRLFIKRNLSPIDPVKSVCKMKRPELRLLTSIPFSRLALDVSEGGNREVVLLLPIFMTGAVGK